MSKLLIAGAGGHGMVVADAALAGGRIDQVEFFDDARKPRETLHGHAVRGDISALLALVRTQPDAQVIVGIGNNARRLSLTQELSAAGATLATVIHPQAIVSSRASVGAGSVLMAGCVVNIGSQVGMGCIINTRASIDHDAAIGDGVHVCPGVSLAGNVVIGNLAWVGIGSTVIQGVKIGAGATIGAGAVVIRDVPEKVTMVGNPARQLRHE